MSVYCGKCDVFDWYVMIPQDDERTNYRIQNTKFFIDGVETEINTIKDLAPYFPCIVGLSTWSGGKTGHGTVHFSSVSYADEEERLRLKYRLLEAKKAYRKLKRKKQEITFENVYNGWYHFNDEDEIDKIITQRIIEDYDGADTRGITTSMGRHYRYELYQTMVELGYTVDEAIAWVYEHKKIWKD